MNTGITAAGVVLVIIALILGAMQHFGMYNFYGDDANKWYFYGIVGVIGLIGIILAAWGAMKKTAPTATTTTAQPKQ
jgi:hypothetical protein